MGQGWDKSESKRTANFERTWIIMKEYERKTNQIKTIEKRIRFCLSQFRSVCSAYDIPIRLHSQYYESMELYELHMQKSNLNNVTIHLIGQFFHSWISSFIQSGWIIQEFFFGFRFCFLVQVKIYLNSIVLILCLASLIFPFAQ